MPHTSQMIPSRYLKQEDVGKGLLLTIVSCEEHNVASENDPKELRWGLTFAEIAKPMTLNSTNIQVLEALYGPETDGWIGKRLVAYVDPSVMFGGKRVGGIRVRAPKATTPPPVPVKVPAIAPDVPGEMVALDDFPF